MSDDNTNDHAGHNMPHLDKSCGVEHDVPAVPIGQAMVEAELHGDQMTIFRIMLTFDEAELEALAEGFRGLWASAKAMQGMKAEGLIPAPDDVIKAAESITQEAAASQG